MRWRAASSQLAFLAARAGAVFLAAAAAGGFSKHTELNVTSTGKYFCLIQLQAGMCHMNHQEQQQLGFPEQTCGQAQVQAGQAKCNLRMMKTHRGTEVSFLSAAQLQQGTRKRPVQWRSYACTIPP